MKKQQIHKSQKKKKGFGLDEKFRVTLNAFKWKRKLYISIKYKHFLYNMNKTSKNRIWSMKLNKILSLQYKL